MSQIAADELDVSPDRIDLRTGDTTLNSERGLHGGASRFNLAASRFVSFVPRYAVCFSRPPHHA